MAFLKGGRSRWGIMNNKLGNLLEKKTITLSESIETLSPNFGKVRLGTVSSG
jgi:hypothetical protein